MIPEANVIPFIVNPCRFMQIPVDSGNSRWNPTESAGIVEFRSIPSDSGGFRRNLWRTEKYCSGGAEALRWGNAHTAFHDPLLSPGDGLARV